MNIEAWAAIGVAVLGAVVLVLKAIPGEQPGESMLGNLYEKLKGKK